MDGRGSFDRSSTEAVRSMPAPDGYSPYKTDGGSFESDRAQQAPLDTSGNEDTAAVEAVLQSDVH